MMGLPFGQEDQLLRALMQMVAEEQNVPPHIMFGGAGPGGMSLGDYVTNQRGSARAPITAQGLTSCREL
jgi:hypothetical protein